MTRQEAMNAGWRARPEDRFGPYLDLHLTEDEFEVLRLLVEDHSKVFTGRLATAQGSLKEKVFELTDGCPA